MLSWFKKKRHHNEQPLTVDIHSHLLPGLDDGVKTFAEAENLLLRFHELGYQKVITTPHVISDLYKNTPQIINAALTSLNAHLKTKNIQVKVEAAAEYYLDEFLFQMIETDQPVLTFGDKYLLFETNFITEPFNLKEFIFMATTKGYKLILAHPERYLYLHHQLNKAQDLLDRGVLFQLNIGSISGYYSKPAQQMAFKLIDRGWVHWLGSDCHHEQHIKLIEGTLRSKYWKKALTLPLLNNSLQ